MNELDNPLTDRVTPQERLYAMLIVAFGKDSDSPNRSTRRVALLESGLPADSHIPDKPQVQAFITMLQTWMKYASERIQRLQEVGVELAVLTDLELLADPQTDSKLRHRIAQAFLDRDPRGRDLKHDGESSGTYGEEPSGITEFKLNAARFRQLEGKATREDLRLLEAYSCEEETQ